MMGSGRSSRAILATLADSDNPSYLVRAEGAGQTYLIERSAVRIELDDASAAPFVRVYQAIYAPAQDERRKDVFQESDGRISLYGKENVWLNMGNPHRALSFVRKYIVNGLARRKELAAKLAEQGSVEFDNQTFTNQEMLDKYHGRPLIRSFLIPKEIYEEITGKAIDELQLRALGKYTKNSDQPQASDQYAVNKEGLALIRKYAKPGSLITYVLDDYKEDYALEERNGEIVGFSELLDDLGMPKSYLIHDGGLMLPLQAKKDNYMEQGVIEQTARAEVLGQLYDESFNEETGDFSKKLFQETGLTWPTTEEDREMLRAQLASAASFCLMHSILRSNYNEVTKVTGAHSAVFKGREARGIESVEVSQWTAKQEFKEVIRAKKNGV